MVQQLFVDLVEPASICAVTAGERACIDLAPERPD